MTSDGLPSRGKYAGQGRHWRQCSGRDQEMIGRFETPPKEFVFIRVEVSARFYRVY
jgi:hypothetical protein